MPPVSIPERFAELAEEKGVPLTIATHYFLARVRRQATQGIRYALVETGAYQTEKEAARVLSELWATYQREVVGFENAGLPGPVEGITRPTSAEPSSYMEEARNAFQRLVGPFGKPKAKPVETVSGREIIVSDTHLVFGHEPTICQVLEDPAERVVVLGDLLDMYALSRHRKTIDHITVRQEMAMGRAFLEELSSRKKVVKVMKGNHDDRGLKAVQNLAPQLIPLITHPIDVLCSGLDNVEVVGSIVPESAPPTAFGSDIELPFLHIVGNTAFGHFEQFYGENAPSRLLDWLATWNHVLKLEVFPKIVFHAHTHRLACKFLPNGTLLVSTGCACRPMEYHFLEHGKFPPPTNGYVSYCRDPDGMVDPNSVKLHFTGESS